MFKAFSGITQLWALNEFVNYFCNDRFMVTVAAYILQQILIAALSPFQVSVIGALFIFYFFLFTFRSFYSFFK